MASFGDQLRTIQKNSTSRNSMTQNSTTQNSPTQKSRVDTMAESIMASIRANCTYSAQQGKYNFVHEYTTFYWEFMKPFAKAKARSDTAAVVSILRAECSQMGFKKCQITSSWVLDHFYIYVNIWW